MKNVSQQIDGIPPVIWHADSSSSAHLNFDEKKIAEMHQNELNIFSFSPRQLKLNDKRQKNELAGAGLVSCSSPSLTSSYNLHDSPTSLNLHSSQQEHAASLNYEKTLTKNYTLQSPNTIYPTPPPSAPWYWFNEPF